MKPHKFVLFLLYFISTVAEGQTQAEKIYYIDSTVVVKGRTKAKEINVGAKVTKISEEILQSTQTQSLAELLSGNSTINIKSLGKGALATSSFRGTSSNHTQVNWNDISINSPMLGNFDFSQVPVIFTDNVTLYHGSSYMKGGTGALGGSINLNNSSEKCVKPEYKIISEFGSDATFTEAASVRFTEGKLTSSTRLNFQKSRNDFRYLNKVLSKDEFYERRKDADYIKYGVMQQLDFELNKNSSVSANIWFQGDDRSLPQPIMVYRTSHEDQASSNLRSYVDYKTKFKNHSFKATIAYLRDYSVYSREFDISLGDTTTNNLGHSIIAKLAHTYSISPKLELNSTLNSRYDMVISDNYEFHNASRNTINASSALMWTLNRKFSFNGQIMAEVNGKKAAPTYSLGANYNIIENTLSVKVSNAYNYRFPTLNDLYWNPGGNRDLKPENGFSYDATVKYSPKLKNIFFNFEATYYRMDINNWIMWIPTTNGYIWKPENFNRVLSQGVEIMASARLKTGVLYHTITFNYGYSPSIDQSSRGDGTLGKQLPYIPLNRWNGRYSIEWKNLMFNYSINFTDVRYTTADQSYSTNAYTIHDAELRYKIKLFKKLTTTASLRVDNLTDAYYESTQYYPMPLRSYYFSLTLVF